MSDVKARLASPETLRPLSPHLQIYRWSWTMAMSVFHRLTGLALYGGTVLLVWWLVALAIGPGAYEPVRWVMGSILGKLVLIGFTWALFHHMLGGLRHFLWDMGLAFERGPRMALAQLTLVGSVLLTIAVWALVLVLR